MSCLRKIAVLLMLGTTPQLAWAQAYEGTECKALREPKLKTQLQAGSIDSLATFAGNYVHWASSFLAPSGKPPVKPASQEFDAQEAYQEALVNWSCRYSPGMAQDGDTSTAWVEGVDGYGVGEVLLVQVNTQKPVRIWAGYGKSPALHAANSRPRRVRVTVLQTLQTPGGAQVGYVFANIKALAVNEVELKDINGYQPLPMPPHELRQAKTAGGDPWPLDDPMYAEMTFVALEILSVYPGGKYTDTAISQVDNEAAK